MGEHRGNIVDPSDHCVSVRTDALGSQDATSPFVDGQLKVHEILSGVKMSAVCLAHREQGFLVAPGNRKQILTWNDLAKPGVTFINRQRGAGTRVLTDFELNKQGIDSCSIVGYRREVYTHLAVAASVKNGEADAGVGVLAAAKALGLDFVPLAKERYELILRRESLDTEPIQALLAVLTSEAFKQELLSLGGYDVTETGVVRA